MWIKRWSGAGKTPDGQYPGNHAVGFVEVERDTIGMWLLFNSELCMGLPQFSADMIFAQDDKSVSAERKEKRRRWWQTIDQEVLASDVAGFQLRWRTFSHLAQDEAGNHSGDVPAELCGRQQRTQAQQG